jgi:hypothetical protein
MPTRQDELFRLAGILNFYEDRLAAYRQIATLLISHGRLTDEIPRVPPPAPYRYTKPEDIELWPPAAPPSVRRNPPSHKRPHPESKIAAVLDIVERSPGPFHLRDIVRDLKGRVSYGTVGVHITKLRANGHVERVGHGLYRATHCYPNGYTAIANDPGPCYPSEHEGAKSAGSEAGEDPRGEAAAPSSDGDAGAAAEDEERGDEGA